MKDPGFLQAVLEKAERLVCCLKPYMDICEVYGCHYLLNEHKQFVDVDATSTVPGRSARNLAGEPFLRKLAEGVSQ